MRTRPYILKGKDVPAGLQNTSIPFPVFESMADALTRMETEADLLELVQSAHDVWLQGRLRGKAAAKTTPTAEQLIEFAGSAKYARRGEGTGNGEVKPETLERRAAAQTGTALFEKALANPEKRAEWIADGILDEAKFNQWRQAREAKAVAAANKANGGNGGTAQAAEAPAAPTAEVGRRPGGKKANR